MQGAKSLGIVGGVMLLGWGLMKMTTPSREKTIQVPGLAIELEA